MTAPTLPLFPIREKSPLVGIARLASEGESLREGHNVEYFTLPARSLLNRCVSNRGLPFTWTINPYRGCEFACKYCYARSTHEFMEMRDGTGVRAEDLRQATHGGAASARPSTGQDWRSLRSAPQPIPTSRRSAVMKSQGGIPKEFARHRRLRAWHCHQIRFHRPRSRSLRGRRQSQRAINPHHRNYDECRAGAHPGAARASS